MIRRLIPFLIISIVIVTSCSGSRSEVDIEFSEPESVLQLQVEDLFSHPDKYHGRMVKVGGRISFLSPTQCATGTTLLPPVSFTLADGESMIYLQVNGNGIDLAPPGLAVLLEGRWLHWTGPVGCESLAVPTSMWYLQVTRVLYPNPLMQAIEPPGDLTPQPIDTPIVTKEIVQTLATPAVPTPSQLPSPTGRPTGTSTSTPTVTPMATPMDSPLATPTRLQASPTSSSMDSPLASPTLTPSGVTSSPSPEPTRDQPTATLTPTASPTSSPTFTPTPEVGEMGTIDRNTILNAIIAVQSSHRWSITLSTGEQVRISSGPSSNLDLSLSLLSPSGHRVAGRDDGGDGIAETIQSFSAPSSGMYTLEVNAERGTLGSYGILVQDSNQVPIVFRGNLHLGDNLIRSLPEQTHHVWHFEAEAFDEVQVEVSPRAQLDVKFSLYGPEMGSPIAVIDHALAGGVEIETFTLQETGLYSIYVQEYSDLGVDYGISLQ